MINLLNRFQN